MPVPKSLLYFCSFVCQPALYILTKEYKRGIIMHFVGFVTMSLAVAIIQIGFIIGQNTLSMIYIGSGIVFIFYGVLVYDCFLIIRNLESKKIVHT